MVVAEGFVKSTSLTRRHYDFQTDRDHHIVFGPAFICPGCNGPGPTGLRPAAAAGRAKTETFGEEFDARIAAFRSAAEQDPDRNFTTLSEAEQARWDERLQTVIDGWIEATPNGQALYDAYTAAVAEVQ